MDAIRTNAALVELNNINQSLSQRCINLAADLAEANAKLQAANEEIKTLKAVDVS